MRTGPEPALIRGMFTRIAAGYDRFNGVASLGLDRRWRREAVRRLPPLAGGRILDLAAGTGDMTLALAGLPGPSLVVSSDFTPAMLAAGRRKVEKPVPGSGCCGRVAFSLADATRLPFASGSFDAVTVAFGLRNFTDRAGNYREVLRVLAPRGRYVVLEFTQPGFAPLRPFYRLYLRQLMPWIGARLAGDRAAFEYLHGSIAAFPDAPALAAEMVAAGFADVQFRKLSMGIVAVHVATKGGD